MHRDGRTPSRRRLLSLAKTPPTFDSAHIPCDNLLSTSKRKLLPFINYLFSSKSKPWNFNSLCFWLRVVYHIIEYQKFRVNDTIESGDLHDYKCTIGLWDSESPFLLHILTICISDHNWNQMTSALFGSNNLKINHLWSRTVAEWLVILKHNSAKIELLR